MIPAVLNEISKDVLKRLAARKKICSYDELLRSAQGRQPKDFSQAFKEPGVHIIAEVKFASPTEGDIHSGDAVDIGREYLNSGACALSVLTEVDHFKGSLENLKRLREAFPQSYLLMKDFIVDEYQIAEGLAYGADAILLIVALLGKDRTEKLLAKTKALGLSALVEVHTKEELEIAIECGAGLIGVNNRDLKTMKVDLSTSKNLAPMAHKKAILISESGLKNSATLQELSALGFKGFLIGTSLMKTGDPGQALKDLLAKCHEG